MKSRRPWPRLTIGGGGNSCVVLLLLPGVVVGDAVALLEHLALHGLDGLDPLRPMKVIQSESKILRLTSHLLYFLKITETINNTFKLELNHIGSFSNARDVTSLILSFHERQPFHSISYDLTWFCYIYNDGIIETKKQHCIDWFACWIQLAL